LDWLPRFPGSHSSCFPLLALDLHCARLHPLFPIVGFHTLFGFHTAFAVLYATWIPVLVAARCTANHMPHTVLEHYHVVPFFPSLVQFPPTVALPWISFWIAFTFLLPCSPHGPLCPHALVVRDTSCWIGWITYTGPHGLVCYSSRTATPVWFHVPLAGCRFLRLPATSWVLGPSSVGWLPFSLEQVILFRVFVAFPGSCAFSQNSVPLGGCVAVRWVLGAVAFRWVLLDILQFWTFNLHMVWILVDLGFWFLPKIALASPIWVVLVLPHNPTFTFGLYLGSSFGHSLPHHLPVGGLPFPFHSLHLVVCLVPI